MNPRTAREGCAATGSCKGRRSKMGHSAPGAEGESRGDKEGLLGNRSTWTGSHGGHSRRRRKGESRGYNGGLRNSEATRGTGSHGGHSPRGRKGESRIDKGRLLGNRLRGRGPRSGIVCEGEKMYPTVTIKACAATLPDKRRGPKGGTAREGERVNPGVTGEVCLARGPRRSFDIARAVENGRGGR